ncbi:CxxxxCH/CxxCH domain-containing protein [Winogradskyella sp.]
MLSAGTLSLTALNDRNALNALCSNITCHSEGTQ